MPPRPASQSNAKPRPLTFRAEVRPDDAEAVARLVAGTGFFNPAEIQVAEALVRERLAKGAGSGYEFVFCESGGRLLGYACYGAIAGTQASHDLYWIVVEARAQGQGIGKALLAETEARIRQAGGRRVYVETSSRAQYAPTRAFYERAGYCREALLVDFYAPGDGKVIYVKVPAP
jgi:ribosomal protein S18 acetylase RimI-like enzyme